MYFTILIFYFALNGIVIFSFLLLLKNGVFWWRHQNRFSWIQGALSNFKKANQVFIQRYVICELFTQKSFCPSYLSQKMPVTPWQWGKNDPRIFCDVFKILTISLHCNGSNIATDSKQPIKAEKAYNYDLE